MAVQNGTEIATGSQKITYYDTITATGTSSAPVFKTKFTAVGTTTAGVSNDDEIGFIYLLNSDGTYGEKYVQVKTLGAQPAREFTYDSASKIITFNTATASLAPVFEDSLACAYQYKTGSTAQRIELTSYAVPPTVLVSAYGIARDTCTGDLFPCVIEGQAQVDGNWNFDLTADGDPVVQNLSMEFVKSCTSNNLYNFTIYTSDDETVAG